MTEFRFSGIGSERERPYDLVPDDTDLAIVEQGLPQPNADRSDGFLPLVCHLAVAAVRGRPDVLGRPRQP